MTKKYLWFPMTKWGMPCHVSNIPKITDGPNREDGTHVVTLEDYKRFYEWYNYDSTINEKNIDVVFHQQETLKLILKPEFMGRAYNTVFVFFRDEISNMVYPIMSVDAIEAMTHMNNGILKGEFRYVRRHTYYYGIKLVENPEKDL